MGLYTVLGILGLFLIWREIDRGPLVESLSNLQAAAGVR